MESGEISLQKYAEYVQKNLNELENADIDGLPAIIASVFVYEHNNSLLLRKEFEPLNKELYLALKEKAVHPLLTAERINAELILLAGLIAKSGFRVPKNSADRPIIQKLSDKFSSIKDENYHSIKTHYAAFLFVAETFKGDGSDTRSNFLERLADLNVNTFQQSEANFNSFMGLLKNIIDRQTALEILKSSVFKGKFWNKDLNTKKSNFLWVVPFLWNTFGFEKEFKELYPIWLDIFRKAIQKNMTELVFFMHFHLSHIYLNLAHTQQEFKQFNDDVEKPLSEYIKTKVIPEYSITTCVRKKADTPRKVGFVYDRLINNSPTKLLYSWLERLTKENPETEYFVYDIEYVEKSASEQHFINLITGLGVTYFSAHKAIRDADKYSYYSHFDKTLILHNKIMQDGIDELIMCNNREQFNFLFTARTAPLQTYWCHGNFEYDLEGIDKRVTHINGMQENNLPFERFHLVQSDIFFAEEQKQAKVAASVIRKRFPENTIILGSIGRLIKIEGEGYLETVAEIMRQNPDTVYLACGSGGKDNIFKKAKELGIADRFFFEGQVDPQVYAHVIDIYLNTFPNPSGEAANEYLKLNSGTGVVSLSASLAEYKWQAKGQIELHRIYGREAIREMYLYDGKSRKINENSPVIKDIKAEAENIRSRYPTGTVFIGITGDINIADEELKNFLYSLPETVFIYSEEENKTFPDFAHEKAVKAPSGVNIPFISDVHINMYRHEPRTDITEYKLRLSSFLINNKMAERAKEITKSIDYAEYLSSKRNDLPINLIRHVVYGLRQEEHLFNAIERVFVYNNGISLLTLMKVCAIPAVFPIIRRTLAKTDCSFTKADPYTDELCFLFILAEMYDSLMQMSNLYAETPQKQEGIHKLFLHNFFQLAGGKQISELDVLPKAFINEKNTVLKSLGEPLLLSIIRRLEQEEPLKQDISVIGLVSEMMLKEYEIGNLDLSRKDFLLRALIYNAKSEQALRILQDEAATGNHNAGQYINCAVLNIIKNNLKQAEIFLQNAEISPSENYTPIELLQIVLVHVFCSDFEAAHTFIELLYKADKNLCAETPFPTSTALAALVYKSFQFKEATNLWHKAQEKDVFHQYREHLWNKVPISDKLFSAYSLDRITDLGQ